jgi:diacylglycerol kinase (ATP)
VARMRVIVNPAAGAGKTAKKWPEIMSLLKSLGLDFEHDVTEAPGHAIELAKSAVGKGYELVVSVGGDGTIHEIVNGLHDAGGNTSVAVGIVNTGTGADYIRTIGVPRRYKEACQCLLSCL